MNSVLLGRLKRLCAPDLGEDEYARMSMRDIPSNWPVHLAAAVRFMNERILPHLRFSPKELLMGLVVNTPRTPVQVAVAPLELEDVALQMAYASQQRLDGYAQIVDHAVARKAAFDKMVLRRAPREVIFRAGQLVQVYRNDLDFTVQASRKMEPKWSAPRRVLSRDRNSYKLATLEGLAMGGRFNSRRLRRFIPRNGTAMHDVQEAIETAMGLAEEEADRVGDADAEERAEGAVADEIGHSSSAEEQAESVAEVEGDLESDNGADTSRSGLEEVTEEEAEEVPKNTVSKTKKNRTNTEEVPRRSGRRRRPTWKKAAAMEG